METGTRQTAGSRTKNGNRNSPNIEFPHKKNAGTRQKVGSRKKAGRVTSYHRKLIIQMFHRVEILFQKSYLKNYTTSRQQKIFLHLYKIFAEKIMKI